MIFSQIGKQYCTNMPCIDHVHTRSIMKLSFPKDQLTIIGDPNYSAHIVIL